MKRLISTIALACAVLLAMSCEKEKSGIESISWKETAGVPVWKGEKTHAQAIICSDTDVDNVTLELCGPECVSANFVSYVTGDVLGDSYGQCGARKPGQWDSIRVADRIGPESAVSLKAGVPQPVWVSIHPDAATKAGKYKAVLKVKGDGFKTVRLPLTYEVADRTLPEPHEWGVHIDLWQNPYAVARWFNVPLWSDEHFEKMAPVMKILADAGQKSVTATIIDRPWNGQTEDPFGSMVVKTRTKDGVWSYDYSIFDKWVEFMFSLGIDHQINCYSLIPWKLTFDYIEAETGETKFVEAAPDTPEYKDYWASFIKDFASHLREKGWFEKTMIAMDERPLESMVSAVAVIKEAEPGMKISMAGLFHEEISDQLDYFSIPAEQFFPDGALEARRAQGKTSTCYVCCAQAYPNTFIASNPGEAAWWLWYAAANEYDGVLKWAYNSWTADPVNDARFRSWPAGDCFVVYPDGSSVRMENLIEGAQDFEKLRILKNEWEQSGNTEKLDSLDKVLDMFILPYLKENGPGPALSKGRNFINTN